MLKNNNATRTYRKAVAEAFQKGSEVRVARCPAIYDVPEPPSTSHRRKNGMTSMLIISEWPFRMPHSSRFFLTQDDIRADRSTNVPSIGASRKCFDPDRSVTSTQVQEPTGPNFTSQHAKHRFSQFSRRNRRIYLFDIFEQNAMVAAVGDLIVRRDLYSLDVLPRLFCLWPVTGPWRRHF